MKKLLSLTALFCAISLFAQDWDVTNPNEPFKETTISVEEGTWMNLDVSPDGKKIVFDLLGDLYIIPIAGGEAKPLRTGHAYEVQPRFSPNGKKISFTSDAGGGDNIWVMDVDGTNATQVTKEDFRLLNNAVWTPDGQYLIARKHFTSGRSLGAGEMWMYHISGGAGIQITKRKNDQQDAGEPWVSGNYLYYSEDVYPGGNFQYNKDPNSQIYVIKRYNRETAKTETVVRGPGGAVRPQISPDGKKLAFVRRVRTKSVLYIHDLATGTQKPVYDDLTKDQQEAWAIFGVYPNFNWLPDNKTIILYAKGKIRRLNTTTGIAEIIPFKATASHKITDALVFKQNPAPEKFNVNVIRNATTSPDGKLLAFNAVGHIYTMKLPKGTPKRLTKNSDFEFEPSFSPDGASIVYVTWNDEQKGAIMKAPTTGGAASKLTGDKGIYRTPTYSPDGKIIVYKKDDGDGTLGHGHTTKPGIYTMSSLGGQATIVTEDGEYPVFSKSGDRIFLQTGGYLFGSLDKTYKSVNIRGEDEKIHFHSKYANQYAVSPDGKWLAFGELYDVFVMPFSDHGQVFELTGSTKSLPVTKVADDAGINLEWSADNQSLHWTLGNKYHTVNVKDCFTFLEGSPDSIGEIPKKTVTIDLEMNTDKPEGSIALTGAKIITMEGDQVIENGTIIVKENKIIALGKSEDIQIPKGAKTIDVKGKVIMPGIIDTHAHLRAFRYGLSPQKEWTYYANLAFGVTATHDPSSNSETSMSQSEMVKSGEMIGPRIFSTGTILYGADGDFKAVVNKYEDAQHAITRTKAYGTFSVKSYNQPRREQRQMIIKAARENEVMVYPEGGSTFFHNMTMMLDGHTSVEHNLPVAPLYDDVISLWSASKTSNTPTLIVNYGGVNAEYYWYQNTKVWEHEKLLKYTPRGVIDSRSRHRTMIPQEEYDNGHILVSQSCKALANAGVKICVGGHGQLQGLGVHWEMWSLSQGGMTNMQVIRAATIHGAEYIGMGESIGSLKVGKLADLIVLDADPLDDIRNTEFVSHTMVNGRLFDTATMNEIGNDEKPRGKFYWELEGFNDNFPWHEESHSFMGAHCSCQH
ncbi:MAG: imidazolonepropionase-like amidohydrolase/Tol biopolymer transport system component [Cyclobacteriaceae bacterium]|jgi:imidazolonepropionase-like amidohydrolase/Tol biopolymer transport system component